MEYYIKMFKNNQVFSVRKSRKFRNLVGAIMAGAVLVVLGVGSASADEVATPANTNTANTTQVSPVNTTEKVEVSKDATFNTEVPTTAKLNEAVSNAKNAGVTVNETSATTVDSDKTAQNDYDKQAVAIDKATQDYQKATEAYNKEVEVWGFEHISVEEEKLGLKGSPTRVWKSFTKGAKAAGKVFEVEPAEAADIIVEKLKEKFII